MLIKVLGSAAGGGFPQANCNCRNCADVRLGKPGLRARTQSSLAVSADGRAWALLNASPDLRQQIAATPELAPRPDAGPRCSPIEAVVLTNGDVDHVAGLLSLREGFAFTLYGSQRVLDALAANSIFNVLMRPAVPRMPLAPGERIELAGGLTSSSRLSRARQGCAVPGGPRPAATSVRARATPSASRSATRPPAPSFLYIPGCAAVDARLPSRLAGAPLVVFDGTLYSDGEMIAQGLSSKTGRRMGHISMSGAQGSIAAFAALGVKRRIYVHINNSNPVLRDDSPERAQVERAGWEIAFDGMEIHL